MNMYPKPYRDWSSPQHGQGLKGQEFGERGFRETYLIGGTA